MKRANPAVIGGFILGALVLSLAALVVVGSGKFLQPTLSCVLYFDGAVQGLQAGAPVNFRGVKLGTVKAVKLLFNLESLEVRIPVIVELAVGTRADVDMMSERDKTAREALQGMIEERGLRAQLQLASLVTGQLFVQLDVYPDASPRRARPDPATGLMEIPTVPTTLQEVTSTVRKALDKLAELPLEAMLQNVERTLQGIERLVNAPEILEAFRNVNIALTDVQQMARTIDKDVQAVATRATSVLGGVQQLATGVQHLASSAEKQLGRVASSAATTLGQVGNLAQHTNQQVTPFLDNLAQTSGAALQMLGQASQTLAAVQKVIAPNAPMGYEIVKALRELSAAAHALRVLADYLERHPNAVVFGRREAAPQ